MSLIKKINQYFDNNWQEFVLDANTLNLEEYDKQIKETYIEPLENKNIEQDTAISEKVNKSGDTVTGSLSVEGQLLAPNSPDNPESAFVTDAYTMRVTANEEQEVVDGSLTEISKIKGSTVRDENLIPFPYTYGSYTSNGITFTVNDDGSITMKTDASGATNETYFFINSRQSLDAGTYYLAGAPNVASASTFYIRLQEDGQSPIDDLGSGNSFTTTKSAIYTLTLNIRSGAVITNPVTIKPVLYSGSAVRPFIPRFTDLKHANISAIKSTGRNLFDKRKAKDGYEIVTGATGAEGVNAEWFVTNLIPVIPNTRYTITGKENGSVVTQYDVNKKPLGSFDDGRSGFTTYSNAAFVKLNGKLIQKDTFQLEIGATASEYTPYTEDIYQLPETLELGEWDSFNPQTGEVVRQTETVVYDGTEDWREQSRNDSVILNTWITLPKIGSKNLITTFGVFDERAGEENVTLSNIVDVNYIGTEVLIDVSLAEFPNLESWKAYLAEQYAKGTPVTIAYKLKTPEIEKIPNTPVGYTVYNKGSETIIQGDTDNSVFGAMPTITQKYSIIENPKEVANKAYVQNGLAKKLDKIGGKVTGSLTVEGGVNTTLPALVVKNNDVTYGLTYDTSDEAYKLGRGVVNDDGDFSFYDNEGLPVALRDDSSSFTDGHSIVWSDDGNKIKDSGSRVITESDISNLDTKKVDRDGDTISGILNIEGALTLPNSPTTPEKSEPVSQAYTMRKTANKDVTGLTIVDGSMTEISEIKGKTVRSENLFDKSLAYYEADKDFANCTDIVVSDDKNVVTMTGNEGSGDHAWSSGWFRPLYYAVIQGETAGIVCKAGDVITVSADITLITQGARSAEVGLLANNDGTGSHQVGRYAITTTKKRYVWTVRYSIDKNEHLLFTINSNRVRFENIMISKNGVTEYIPYFTDLKHTNISAIKSTGRNLFDLNLLSPYITKDSEDENYFKFKVSPSTVSEFKLFDEPKNIYAKIKYKAYDTSRPANERGAFPKFIKNDGTYYELSTYLNRNGEERAYIKNVVAVDLTFGSTPLNTIGEFIISFEDVPFEPYTEEIYQLPETLDLGEYDSFNPQTGEITRQTAQYTCTGKETYADHFNTGYNCVTVNVPYNLQFGYLYVHNGIYPGRISTGSQKSIQFNEINSYFSNATEFMNWLKTQHDNGTPVIVDCKLETPTIEKIYNVPVGYTVYNNGSETIIQGETDNSVYGAMPTITQIYSIHENPTEAANKAYVNNGLAKKLDKTGGTITGSLTVENGTDTTLPALVVRNNDSIYGLTLEDDTYKLGQGAVDENGNFTFNEGEGLPIALRDDSSTFADGELVMWSAEGNKFVSTGVTIENINKVVRLI